MTLRFTRKFAIALLLALSGYSSALSEISSSQEVMCLAKNIYYESRGESRKGRIAVAQVTLNRVNHPHFPNTVCKVVYQKHQFSWTKDKRRRLRDKGAWQESLELAVLVLNGEARLKNFPATHFHQKSAKPSWRRHLKKWGSIGSHYFYF
jgi:N-acetylmuramoyl-L-alanine amidase